MTWLAWRQARAQVLVAAAATLAIVAVLVATRDHIATTPSEDLSTLYESLQLFGTLLIGVPAAIGAFWGAPLLAREIELGTHRLAWTQGITRTRWLVTKVVVLALAAAAVTAVFATVFTWWSLPFDETGNRIGTANFGQRGIAPIAYALFALALGTLVGAIVRRTQVAMAISLVGFFAARFAFQLFVRSHLMATVAISSPTTLFGEGESASRSGSWVISSSIVDRSGTVIPSGTIDQLLADTCHLTRASDDGAFAQCARDLGIHDVVKAHPASHFWPLQIWESAAFGLAAVLLAAASVWWIRRRPA